MRWCRLAAATAPLLLLLPVLAAEAPSAEPAELTADLLNQLRLEAGEFGDKLWSRSASSDDTQRLRRYLRDYVKLLAHHGVREPNQLRALVAQHAALLPAVITQPEALRPLLMADGARRLSMYNLLDAEVPLLGQPETERPPFRPQQQHSSQQQGQDGDNPSRVVVFSAYNKDVPAEVRDKLTASDAPLGEGELDGLLLELLQAAAQRHETLGESGPTAPTGPDVTGGSGESGESPSGDRNKKGIVSVSKKDSQTSYIIYPDRQPAANRPRPRLPQQRLDDDGFQTINAQVETFDRNRQSLVTSQGVPDRQRFPTPPSPTEPTPPTEQSPPRRPRPQRRRRPTRPTREPSTTTSTEPTTSAPASPEPTQATTEVTTPRDRVSSDVPEGVTARPQSEVEARSTTRLSGPGEVATEQTGQSSQYGDYPQDDELLQYYYDEYQGGDYQSGPGFRPAQDDFTSGGPEERRPPAPDAGSTSEQPVMGRPAVIKSSLVIIQPPPEPPKGDDNRVPADRYTATPPAINVSARPSEEEQTQSAPVPSSERPANDPPVDQDQASSDNTAERLPQAASGGPPSDQPEISPGLQAFLQRFEKNQREQGGQQSQDVPQEGTGMSAPEDTEPRRPSSQPIPEEAPPVPEVASRRPEPSDARPANKYPKDPWELFNALFEDDDPTEPPPPTTTTTTPAPTRPARRPMPSLSDLLIPLLASYHRFQQVSLGEQRPTPRPTPAGPLGQIPLLVPPSPTVYYAPTPPPSPPEGLLAHRLGRPHQDGRHPQHVGGRPQFSGVRPQPGGGRPQPGGGRPQPGGGRPQPGGGRPQFDERRPKPDEEDDLPQIQTIPLSDPQLRLPQLPPPFGVFNGVPVTDGQGDDQARPRPEEQDLGGGRPPWFGAGNPNRPDIRRPWPGAPSEEDRRRPPTMQHGAQNRVGTVAESERPPLAGPERPIGNPRPGAGFNNANRRRPRPRPPFNPDRPQNRPQPAWFGDQGRPWSGPVVQDDRERPSPDMALDRVQEGPRPEIAPNRDQEDPRRPMPSGVRPGFRPEGRPRPRPDARPRPPDVLAGMHPPLDLAAHWRPDAPEKPMMLATRPPLPADRPELPIRGHFPHLLRNRDGTPFTGRPESHTESTETSGRPGRRPVESSLNGVPVVQLQLPQFLEGLQGARPVPPHLAPPPPRLPLGPQQPGPPLMSDHHPPHLAHDRHDSPQDTHIHQEHHTESSAPSYHPQPSAPSAPETSTEHPVLRLTRPPPPKEPYFPAASPTQASDYGDYEDIITASAPLADLSEIGAPAQQTTTERDLETLGAIVSSVMSHQPTRIEQEKIDRNTLRKRLGMAAVGGGDYHGEDGGYHRYDVTEQMVEDKKPADFQEWQPQTTTEILTTTQYPETVATSTPDQPPRNPQLDTSTQQSEPARPTELPQTTQPSRPTQRSRLPEPTRPRYTRPRPTYQSPSRPTTSTTSSTTTASTSTSTTEIAFLAEVPSQGPALDRSNAVPGLELPGNSTDDAPSEQVKSSSLTSEEIAYVLIGTTAGLSVFCLVIVAITMKCKRNCSVYALLSRLMHSEYIQGLGSRMSSARSHRSATGGGRDAPTHKLGSWFNGRSESLGGAEKFRSNMALPVGYSSNISSLGVKQSKPHGYSVRRPSVSAGQLVSSTSSSEGSVADTSDQGTLEDRRADSGSEGGRAASRGTSWLHGSYVFGGREMKPRPVPTDAAPVQGVLYRRSSDELPPTPAAAAAAASDAIAAAAAASEAITSAASAAESRRSRRRAPSGSQTQQAAPSSRRTGSSRQGSSRHSSSRQGSRREPELGSRRRQQQEVAQAEVGSRASGRHRSRSRAASPEIRSDRHRSQSRAGSPEHRGRRRSHSRARSPEQPTRHRSHSRARSPDRHARRRSQSRARSPERRSRRSVSRSGSPAGLSAAATAAAGAAAARRSPSEPHQQRRRPRDSSRPREVSEHRASLRHVRSLADAVSEGSNSAVNWSSDDERLI